MRTDEVISSEQLLNLVDTLNEDLQKEPRGDMIELTAYDAKALYPSLDTEVTAKAVRQEVLQSKIQFEGLNPKEMARYLAVTSDPWEQKAWGVRSLIPTRRYTKGVTPTITSSEALGIEEGDLTQWVFPDLTPSEAEIRRLLAACCEVGVRSCFSLHTYSFGGKLL